MAKTLLLVEDNPDDEELTLKALKLSGVEVDVIVAHDGVEALEVVSGLANSETRRMPQLILLDLKLPRLNGLEVLERLRAGELTRLIPVVVLTTSLEEGDILKSYRLGANSYIRKPVSFERFLETIRSLGLFWLKYNYTPFSSGKISWLSGNKEAS